MYEVPDFDANIKGNSNNNGSMGSYLDAYAANKLRYSPPSKVFNS